MQIQDRVTRHIVDVALAIMRADFASLQQYDAERKGLKLLNHHGFDPGALKDWNWVYSHSVTGCGHSLRTGRRVIVPDIETCDFLTDLSRETYRRCGIRAMQITPLLAPDGHLLGMVSTHWRTPHRPENSEFDMFDVWARQTADVFTGNEEVAHLLRAASKELDRCQDLIRQLERAVFRSVAGNQEPPQGLVH